MRAWFLRILVGLGSIALGYYFSWWFVDERLRSPWMVLLFISAVLYALTQVVGNWLLYLMARWPVKPAPPPLDLTVDVYVTAYREPYAMIERSLAAACAMRGEHRTWLLDDGSDPALEVLAQRLGAGYLTRKEHMHAKAGNLNAALPRTQGDILAIFDVDHVPAADFLEKSVGYFADPKIGFVQVMLTFANADESWVAQAAMETSLEFYNPTYLGSDAVGGATMMGSNALIRRTALEGIHGYQPGLAEDLATSITLHASGWCSAYVPEPLAPGQAPPSFTAWFVQQLKWARGVFELLLTSFPRLFSKLTWGQRLSYAVRMTKYWIGPVIGFHLFATIAILIFGNAQTRDAFHTYLIQITPLAFSDVLIRYTALRNWQHPATPKTTLSRAVSLIYASWPIYMVAWLMALLRLPLSFRPTPKSTGRLNPIWLLPQFTAVALLSAGTLYTVLVGHHRPSILLVFASIQGILQLILLTQWLKTEVRINEGLPKYLAALRSQAGAAAITRREVNGSVRSYITNLPFTLDPLPMDSLERVITTLHQARIRGRQFFILGDTGNDALAVLFAHDLAKLSRPGGTRTFRVGVASGEENFRSKEGWGEAVNCISLGQLMNVLQPGDVMLTISSDGNANQVVKAVQHAKKTKVKTVTITGLERGRAGQLADVNLHVPSESSEHVEDVFLILEHLICKALRDMGQETRPIKYPLTGEASSVESEIEAIRPRWSDAEQPAALLASDRARTSLEKLYALIQTYNEGMSQGELLRKTLQTSLEVLGASSGSLLLLDEEGEAIEAVIAYNNEIHIYPIEHMLDTLQNGLAGWVVQHRQPVLVANTHQEPRWLRRKWEENNGSRSAISVPLVEAGRVSGVLTLVHSQAGHFTEDDLVLLGAIAVNISVIAEQIKDQFRPRLLVQS